MSADVDGRAARGAGIEGLSARSSTLVTAIQQLALARSLERVQEIVRDAARALAASDGATFVLREEDRCYYADENAISPLWKGQRFPLESCISGWAMRHREAVVIRDIYVDDRIPHDAYRPTFVKSLAMMPIRTLDPVGAIGIYWADEHEPDASELSLLRALADSTAVAMENIAVRRELEQRVRDRTKELHTVNEQLAAEVQSRQEELAEQKRLNEALENFSWRVAHDLRSPIGTIQVAIDTLERVDVPAERRAEIRATLHGQAEKASTLIDDLLALARASGTARRRSIDLAELLESIRADCPEVDLEIGSLPETVHVDPVSFRQALLNVARNAARYAAVAGRAVLTVEAETRDGSTVFSLSDDGPGLPEDLVERVFSPFERGRDEAGPGSGLGLAIVGAMAEAHGGRVWYEHRQGGGASFKIAIADAV